MIIEKKDEDTRQANLPKASWEQDNNQEEIVKFKE